MEPQFHKKFQKQYKKLPAKMREKVKERLLMFKTDPMSPELNNHALHGKYVGCRSINVTGDLRAIYEVRNIRVRFVYLDTHSNLY